MMQTLKKYLTITAVFLLTFGLTTAKASAAETLLGDYLKENNIEVDVSAAIDFYTKYVWRGILLDNDPVLQPSVTLSSNGFEGGFWGSFDTVNDDSLDSTEIDGWIGYGTDLGFIDERLEKLSLSFGHTWYEFPDADTYTKEFYVSASADVLLSPTFTWFHDYNDEDSGGADGNYYIVGLSHSFDVVEDYGITLDLGVDVGFNNKFFIAGDGGYYLTTAGFTIPVTETLTVSPSVGYSVPFGDLEEESDGNADAKFYSDVSLAFSF